MPSIKKSIKNYKIFFGIFLFLIIMVIGFALIMMQQTQIPEKQFNEGNTTGNISQNQTEVIVETPEEAEKWIKEAEKRENITYTSIIYSSLENASFESKPTFKAGEKYTYKIKTPVPFQSSYYHKTNSGKIMEDYVYYNVTFTVDKKERINKSDYYVFSTEGSGNVIVGYVYSNNKKSAARMTFVPPLKWYINTENGKIFNEDMEEIIDYTQTYHPWMLKLLDGLKWTIKREDKSTGSTSCESILGGLMKCSVNKEESTGGFEQTYEVKGIEKINGKKCFKVEGKEKICNNRECTILKTMTYWIDMEKRITVKYQQWYEGLIVVEHELIDYQK